MSHPDRTPMHLCQSLVLADGRRVTLRPVRATDAGMACDFVARLSPQSRRNRFHGAVKGLAPEQARRMTDLDFHEHMAFVATTVEGEGAQAREVLVGDARCSIWADRETAEFAVVVADAWAGLGLARRLLALLGRCARAIGLRWMRGEVLAGNHGMLAFMRRCGFSVAPHRHDEGLVVVENSIDVLLQPAAAPKQRPWAAWLARIAARGRGGVPALAPVV